MKKVCMLCAVLLCLVLLVSCTGQGALPSASVSESVTASVSPNTSPSPSDLETPEPSESPAPTASVFGETPDQAGDSEVLFDIYKSQALADLNQDGTPEQLEFTANDASSTFSINGTAFTVNKGGLAQRFAVTDVDKSDKILEIAFTDKYSDLADSEKAFTWLYWWNGTNLICMGGLMDVKYDGAWRSGFDPKQYFDAEGLVTCLTRTEHFSDVWYNGHYKCSGTDRKLKEELYATKPVNQQEPLTLKEYCLLLKHCDSQYFDPEFSVMWDYASGTSTMPRDYSDDAVAFIPQAGEELKIVAVLGPYWFKLQAADGKKGWLKCIDMKIQGYYQVMHYDAHDIFDGIIIAG